MTSAPTVTRASLAPGMAHSGTTKCSLLITSALEEKLQKMLDERIDTNLNFDSKGENLEKYPTKDLSCQRKQKKKPVQKTGQNAAVSNKPPADLPEIPVITTARAITDNASGNSAVGLSMDWAEMLDVSQSITNFLDESKSALTYPFVLDPFQKQAILKLEEGHNLLVAAHTSAGKTVIAEYAIAMSRRNGNRAIYTSPVKALSNQKFMEFKKIFGDVGLITGDVKINPTAAILVMTTEILRSMLYTGPNATRDLDVVIFDEVHYINNAERGYVWEESLILLPAHVTIVMLSAIVPNAMQFAEWVGRTKGKKVCVATTSKRPVGLRHFLYTGWGHQSDNLFMVLDPDNHFLLTGYEDAVAAKKRKLGYHNKNYVRRGNRSFLKKHAELALWVGLIDTLKQKKKLPLVAFTLSCKRCDQNIQLLRSLDLTNDKEKDYIRSFIQKCLMKLEASDRQLLQVTNLCRSLERGIGAHHSGILPLFKEIVEILFQQGLVKVLFATETFAMGVNMPARTVVLDEITKYDGVRRRTLTPAEYIQMAGRAGRRGLDDTGTVIILCKEKVPALEELQGMMLGMPQKLESKFKLTYSMILALLGASKLSVEGMLKSTFGEFHQIYHADKYKQQLQLAEKEYSEICKIPLAPRLAPLALFYDAAEMYINAYNQLVPRLIIDAAEQLVPGRILVVTAGAYVKQLGVLLSSKGPTNKPYKILLLDTPIKDVYSFNVDDNWYRMLGLSSKYDSIGTEENTLDHTIMCISATNISAITKTYLNIKTRSIIDDWDKRQITRYKNAVVSVNCTKTVEDLRRLSHAVYKGAITLEYFFVNDCSLESMDVQYSVDHANSCWDDLQVCKKNTEIKKFISEFSIVYNHKRAENNLAKYKKLLSLESLALYPDYRKRLLMLREMDYIDENDAVTLKGRMACCMGSNELILTEIVYWNVLNDKSPAVIAGILSCFVYQCKKLLKTTRRYKDAISTIPFQVKEGVTEIAKIHQELSMLECKYGVADVRKNPDYEFVNVMYLWAKQTPFSYITDLTDAPEGTIVRCIQQLHELLVDVKDAAVVLGDKKLEAKLIKACALVKRDIVFTAGLYTT